MSHFTKKADELDLAIEFGQLNTASYEYTDHVKKVAFNSIKLLLMVYLMNFN